ncbi:M23 family metallopeptidase [Nocardioides sambongensis]|uniref:M23 family metallopeptidase n=1 Tax=Nocardioides sambongensis TaxID=2589074 RepID=UPI00112800EF|nr:M23 family metallopeptidase [Nocardioides sambongensis]
MAQHHRRVALLAATAFLPLLLLVAAPGAADAGASSGAYSGGVPASDNGTASDDSIPGTGTVPVGVWPLLPTPTVVHDFDPPATAYGAGHRGVDLAGTFGSSVRSALPGTVLFAGSLAGRGVVVVGHGDTRTTYEPVSASVAVGDRVEAGAVIGHLQLALSHCFPRACLHWGWLRGQTYLDPLLLVGAGPVRLLPLWPGTG